MYKLPFVACTQYLWRHRGFWFIVGLQDSRSINNALSYWLAAAIITGSTSNAGGELCDLYILHFVTVD